MEERPSIRKAAANILNQHSQTADKRWCSSFGIAKGVNNSSPQKLAIGCDEFLQ